MKLAEKYSIILVVDELDRCLPAYSIKVLERLHHVCNEMPVFQIIAIDKKQLAAGISKVYGKIHINKDAYKLIFFNEWSSEDNPYYKKYHLFNSNLAQITKCYLSGI